MRWSPCFCLLALAAQTPVGSNEVAGRAAPYTPVFAGGVIRAQVEMVEVPVVVRNGKGSAVAGLTRQDFELFDTGRKREISSFSIETTAHPAAPAPGNTAAGPITSPPSAASATTPRRFLALVLDDLNTDFANLRRAKLAADRFVSQKLAPGDTVGIFTTALSGTVLFTSDAGKLREAIDAVTPHPRYTDEKHTCPVITAYDAYTIVHEMNPELLEVKAAELTSCTKMSMSAAEQAVRMMSQGIWANARNNSVNTLDAVASVVNIMSRMPGQRIVLLTSNGFISGEEQMRIEAIAKTARRAGVVINSLDLKGLFAVVPGGDASTPRRLSIPETRIQVEEEDAKDDGLAALAESTGGQFFHNNNSVDDGLRRLGTAPDVVYVLGFESGDVAHDGKYHPLKVRLTGGHHGSVQARMGYTAPPREAPSEVTLQSERDRVLMSGEEPSAVAMLVRQETPSDDASKVSVQAQIDIGRLNFGSKEDRRTQKLTMITALLDPSGAFVTGRQMETDLALKDSGFADLARSGLTLMLSLRAAPGPYTLRVLVQEELTGRIAAVSRQVQLH